MKKILTAAQTRLADFHTIKHEPISSIGLMERASLAFVQKAEKHLRQSDCVMIFCGKGNNGGDGFAIARILKNKHYNVQCFAVGEKDMSVDCKLNAERLGDYTAINATNPFPDMKNADIIIDALFGSGLTRPANGLEARIIEQINLSETFVISVDIPSGLYCDAPFAQGPAVCADVAISFQRPKLSFFMPESSPYIKRWDVADIGLNESFIQQQESSYFILDKEICKRIKRRDRFSHKGTYGHALLMVGSHGMMGAAQLSARACLRSGAGLATVLVPQCGYHIMQVAVPECMCLTDISERALSSIPDLDKFSAIAIGPGIGTSEETKKCIYRLLVACDKPLVIDADGLNILAQNKKLLDMLPKGTILTPHPKEFERLAGKWNNSEERLDLQKHFSTKYGCYVLYKGAHTTISTPDGKHYFNTSGNPGMATAGSGDVLTGIVAGLLAQSYSPLDSCLIATYLHGSAGDQASLQRGHNAMIASDIIDNLRIEYPESEQTRS